MFAALYLHCWGASNPLGVSLPRGPLGCHHVVQALTRCNGVCWANESCARYQRTSLYMLRSPHAGYHRQQRVLLVAAAAGTEPSSKKQKPSKQPQQHTASSSRNTGLYELDDDGWGVEAVSPAIQQPGQQQAAAASKPKQQGSPKGEVLLVHIMHILLVHCSLYSCCCFLHPSQHQKQTCSKHLWPKAVPTRHVPAQFDCSLAGKFCLCMPMTQLVALQVQASASRPARRLLTCAARKASWA